MNEKIPLARCREIVGGFERVKILVVGDLMLDEYIRGEVERISPEAPVPVVRVESENWVPGGAANVANNIRALRGRSSLAGVIGADPQGRRLKRILERSRVDLRGVMVDKGRPTVTKSRVLAGHQQVVRIDKEDVSPVAKATLHMMLSQVRKMLDGLDGVILEDYAKGLLNQELVDEIIRLARSRQCLVVVDPNENNPLTFKGATVVTPNRKEALAATGLGRKALLPKIGRALLKKWGPESLLITLGEDGVCLFQDRREPYHIPTVAREVFDVSGAGDTVVSTLSLALASGANLREAAYLANCAAGVVVGKLGTATVSQEELIKACEWR